MRIKTLIIICILYGTVFGSVFAYLNSVQVKEPLFLTHYYQKEIIDSSVDYIPIYYITNQGDDRRLVGVETKAVPGRILYIQEDSIRNSEGIYDYHHALLSIHNIKEEVQLNEMMFTFSDGTMVETDIGAIQLIKQQRMASEPRALNHLAGGSSNAGESYASANVVQDSELMGVNIPFSDVLGDFLNLTLSSSGERADPESLDIDDLKIKRDGISPEKMPMKLNGGDTLKLNALVDKKELYQNDIHVIELWVTGSFMVDGKIVEEHLIGISEIPHLTHEDIKDLKEMREVE